VSFPSGQLTLGGVLYKPEGDGPFPAFLFNHGSAPGRLNDRAFEELGPLFRDRGWVFFAPYRRGQGLSASAGPYIGDEIARAQRESALRTWPVIVLCAGVLLAALIIATRRRRRWIRALSVVTLILAGSATAYATHVSAGAAAMLTALETDHLEDHLAALDWLKAQPFVQSEQIATGGNSLGGIITVLAAERIPYCAAIDGSGGAESWRMSSQLRARMTHAVRNARAPIFFFQAANDYSLAPSDTLSEEMTRAGRPHRVKIYPPFGTSAADGHSFAWQGSAVWAEDVFQFLQEHRPK
jgi:dienelactone hydrolase